MTAIDWPAVRRQLMTNGQVLEVARVRSRHTLLKWRQRDQDPFPGPVVSIDGAGAAGRPLELWARYQVDDWLERHNV